MPVPTRRLDPLALLVVATLTAFTAACDDGGAVGTATVDRATFVATYVDLRLSALGTPSGEITDAERQRVLDEHGVSEDDLMSFADAHGGDPTYMRGVWEDVQRRLRAAAGEDTTAAGGEAR